MIKQRFRDIRQHICIAAMGSHQPIRAGTGVEVGVAKALDILLTGVNADLYGLRSDDDVAIRDAIDLDAKRLNTLDWDHILHARVGIHILDDEPDAESGDETHTRERPVADDVGGIVWRVTNSAQ